jgi:PAS domain S-box-containing protein
VRNLANMRPPNVDRDAELHRLRQMFSQSPSFSALLQGPEHRFVLVNAAYERLIGRSPVVGLSVRQAVPEAEHQGFIDLLDGVYSSGKAFIGKDIKIVLQHASEEALRASEGRLRQLNADLERQVVERAQARGLTWRLSPDLLGALNSKGNFETANPAWETVLGWTEAEVLSMSIFELLHPEDREHTRAGFELTQVGQPALRFANRYRCKDGSYRWISWIGIPEDGYVYCTGQDITAERAGKPN